METTQLLLSPSPSRKSPNRLTLSVTDSPAFYVHPRIACSHSPNTGRLLRASHPIRKGTIILQDSAYAIVPIATSPSQKTLLCSNPACSKSVARDGQVARCSKGCNADVVWCTESCRIVDTTRHSFECQWLKVNTNIIRKNEIEYDFYNVWHVVRLLAERFAEACAGAPRIVRPATTQEGFDYGWAAVQKCCAYPDTWPSTQVKHWKHLVQSYLSDASIFPTWFSPEEIEDLICKEETNTFGLYNAANGPLYYFDEPSSRGESYGWGLFPRAALFNHSCNPNVAHKPDGQGRMVFTAARDITAGEECLITYLDLTEFSDVRARQRQLQDLFRFTCACDRCAEEEAAENMACEDMLPFGDF